VTLEELAARFPGGKWSSSGKYETHCPVKSGHKHDDRNASLGMWRGDKGCLILKCQAGCAKQDILSAVRLTFKDLAAPSVAGSGPQYVAEYRYDREDGTQVATKFRTADKRFFWRQADGRWNLEGVTLPLFGLPELLRSESGSVVGIAEGEKDALNLRKQGLAATTNPHGADKSGSKWLPRYTDWLKQNLPSREFVIFADNDEAGTVQAEVIGESLKRAGLTVRFADLQGLGPGEDVSDWLPRHTEAEFQALLRAPPHPLIEKLLSREQLRNQPPPVWQIEGLFQEASIVEVYGESNHGKSLVGVDIALSVVRAGSWSAREIRKPGAVVYVNADGGAGFADRLRWWEKANGEGAIFEFWTYPEELLLHDPKQIRWFIDGLAELEDAPVMIFFDTLSQCIPGVNENQQEQMSLVVSNLNAIKREYGATTFLLHHVGKDGLNRGSTVIPGAADTIIRCSQVLGELIELRCEKQRNGRKFEPLYFQMRYHGIDEGVYLVQADGPTPARAREEREQRVLDALKFNGDWLSRAELKDRLVGIGDGSLRRYLERLMEDGLIREDERPNPVGHPSKVYLYTAPIED
jgi:hypothetical protein